MDNQSWVTLWEDWRSMMGTPNSAVRREVNKKLESRPCMLYWGDSWFSTPLYKNLARQSMKRIDGMGMLVGKPGARAEKLFSQSEVKNKVDRLKTWPFDVVCTSAGGNDALSDQLAEVFRPYVKGRGKGSMSAEAAYEIFRSSHRLELIRDSYRILLDALGDLRQKEGKTHIEVIGHPYCKIVRLGVPANLSVANIGLIAWVKGEAGPWLWNVLEHVVSDAVQGQIFADRMIEDFKNVVTDRLAASYSFFNVAEFHKLAEPKQEDFWFDEIHPTEEGFSKLAHEFNRTLRDALPDSKRDAVT